MSFMAALREAFSHNMLLFILGTPALIVFIHEYVRVFIFTRLRPVYLSRPAWLVCVVLVFFFLGAEEHPCVQCSRTVKCPLFNTEI